MKLPFKEKYEIAIFAKSYEPVKTSLGPYPRVLKVPARVRGSEA